MERIITFVTYYSDGGVNGFSARCAAHVFLVSLSSQPHLTPISRMYLGWETFERLRTGSSRASTDGLYIYDEFIDVQNGMFTREATSGVFD